MHVYKHLVQNLPRPHNYKNPSRKYIDMHNDANDHTWGGGDGLLYVISQYLVSMEK